MASHEHTTLIVGAAQTGAQIATSLRDLGYPGRIHLVGAETHAPYQRPPLSKTALRSDVTPESLALRSSDYYLTQNIDLHLNEHILSVSYIGDRGIALSDTGKTYTFDKLALAVGASARRLEIPGATAHGVHYLRDQDDAAALRTDLARAQRIVVVGAGFIGLEVAACMRTIGKDVCVIAPSSRIMGRALSSFVTDFAHAQHEQMGVDIRTGTSVRAIEQDADGHVTAVITEDGGHIPADLVVVGIGAIPRSDLAEQLGLHVDNGIVVDDYAVASDGRTIAAGDCANIPNPLNHQKGASRMRLESVNNAVEHAKIAAASIAGVPLPYRTIPWFWSDQYQIKIQSAGVLLEGTQAVVRGSIAEGKFSVFHYDQEHLVGVESVNSPADFMVARMAMSRETRIPLEAVADTGVPLKRLVQSRNKVLETA